MIQNCNNDILVHLADLSVCWCDGASMRLNPKATAGSTLIIKACHETGFYVSLTHDGLLLAGTHLLHVPTDITTSLPQTARIELLEEGTEIHILDCVITVKTLHTVSFITIGYPKSMTDKHVSIASSITHEFPSGITSSGFGYKHGFVRTNDNNLHMLNGDNVWKHPTSRRLEFINPENIQEIITDIWYTLFIMKDGSVRSCGLFGAHNWHPGQYAYDDDKLFELIRFPHEISVAKAINHNHHIFFITTEGQCYYINDNVRESSIVLIQALSSYYVENVFVLEDYVIIQHDGNKLCRLSLSTTNYTYGCAKAYSIDSCYIKGTWKPTALPFFDNKSIVTVKEIRRRIYYISEEGKMYWRNYLYLGTRDSYEELSYFAENPIMVECKTAAIRSAQSSLRH